MKDILIKLFSVYGFKVDIHHGRHSPSVTTYQFVLKTGTRLNSLQLILPDVARDAGISSLRIVNGQGKLFLEVPNDSQKIILFSDTIKNTEFRHSGRYDLMLGIDTFNKMSLTNLRKLPHLLVGGSTGSGKSVGMHMIINSLLVKNKPENLQLLLIDPKKTELSMYNGLPHLISEVLTESEDVNIALNWAVNEMENRYTQMQAQDTRDMLPDMPVILIVIDEMADLILSGDKDIEKNLIRLAQKARACGIHIIAATQRPSREVVTGLIKANFPARLSYKTASVVDSRIILDSKGAESLLGQGDSLYLNVGAAKRVQAAYISDAYLLKLINALKKLYKRVDKLKIFKHVASDMSIKQQNVNTSVIKNKTNNKNKAVNITLGSLFVYTLFSLVKTILSVCFAPVKGHRQRGR